MDFAITLLRDFLCSPVNRKFSLKPRNKLRNFQPRINFGIKDLKNARVVTISGRCKSAHVAPLK